MKCLFFKGLGVYLEGTEDINNTITLGEYYRSQPLKIRVPILLIY